MHKYKIIIALSVAFLVGACSRELERDEPTPTPSVVPEVKQISIATYNVDGLPYAYQIGEYGDIIKTMFPTAPINIDSNNNFIINADGPKEDGSRIIGELIKKRGWDVFGLNEDFYYHEPLWNALSEYTSGRHLLMTEVPLSVLFQKALMKHPFYDVDGLLLGAKKTHRISYEIIRPWNADAVYGYLTNYQDSLTRKGFRYYRVDFDDHNAVDFIILHADAGNDKGDRLAREAAFNQLYDFITQELCSVNPIVVMGDFNCMYSRDRMKELFIDRLNAVEGLSASDVWVEHINNGQYPEYINSDNEGDTIDGKSEMLDKIVYINRSYAPIRLRLESAANLLHFVDNNGNRLSDHYPLEATFTIESNNQPPSNGHR